MPARLASRGSGLLSLRGTRRLGGERSRLLLRARPYTAKRRERAYRACACHGTDGQHRGGAAALRWREPALGRCRGAPSTFATCHRHVSCAFRRLIMRGISGSLRNSAAEGMGERRRWGRVPYFVVCAYGVGLACNARWLSGEWTWAELLQVLGRQAMSGRRRGAAAPVGNEGWSVHGAGSMQLNEPAEAIWRRGSEPFRWANGSDTA